MDHRASLKQRNNYPIRCDETCLEIKMIYLEGAMLDEVDVWLPDVAVMVEGVQGWVPEIRCKSQTS